ncbi:MAG: heterodisulfide reductase subunit B [Bacteroidetes bacterium CG23_combo_of_CG06-09_8_20_14_all_32_9]|nr:MAG: heterodisulfide reductase subunit B [Bacteroidetes bacterium CG23_combo_of_CG06-09_8_20_14_all_32_9]
MNIGFYPGCSLTGTSKEYNESLVAVATSCGITLQEIGEWNCCGASSAHALNHELALLLPSRILALAEQQGFTELLIPCAACYSRIATAQHQLLQDAKLLAEVSEILKIKFTATIKLFNPLKFLSEKILPLIEDKIKNKLNLKVSCYYGCLLVRPPQIMKTERFEDPVVMENILAKCGAYPIDWNFKTECCGASLSIARGDISSKLSMRILRDAADKKAEVVAVACPMCHSNLDMRRPDINSLLTAKIDIPVLFITQLIGMALGIPAEKLGLHRHFVKNDKMVSNVYSQNKVECPA